jgi:hypothetical protein
MQSQTHLELKLHPTPNDYEPLQAPYISQQPMSGPPAYHP